MEPGTPHFGSLAAVSGDDEPHGERQEDVGRHRRCAFFAGLILRRQLLVLIREQVWKLQKEGDAIARSAITNPGWPRHVDMQPLSIEVAQMVCNKLCGT